MGDPQKYIAEILTAIAQGNPSSHVVETGNGRIIQVKNQPMQGGGWVATHEDVTEPTPCRGQNFSHGIARCVDEPAQPPLFP
jgi:hypothetical protein